MQRTYDKYINQVIVNNDFDVTFRQIVEALDTLTTEHQWVPVNWIYWKIIRLLLPAPGLSRFIACYVMIQVARCKTVTEIWKVHCHFYFQYLPYTYASFTHLKMRYYIDDNTNDLSIIEFLVDNVSISLFYM